MPTLPSTYTLVSLLVAGAFTSSLSTYAFTLHTQTKASFGRTTQVKQTSNTKHPFVRNASIRSQRFGTPFTPRTSQATYLHASPDGDVNGSASDITHTTDVLVLGSGPAGRAIASLLGAGNKALTVTLADKTYDRDWVPNYGAWIEEWETVSQSFEQHAPSLSIQNCIDRTWERTDCYFGGSFDIPMEEQFRIERGYVRVDRFALSDALSETNGNYKVIRANHVVEGNNNCVNVHSPAGSLIHDDSGSTVRLSNGDVVRTKLIVDCTGHETKLITKDPSDPSIPGYQIAYGCSVEIDESQVTDTTKFGPYSKDSMALFDYRTDHFPPDSPELKHAIKNPTFMYAMPLKDNKVFFEETSLVARPAVSFQDCKTRCFTRLKHLGIDVSKITEEEFCYIPMGGPLPAPGQRIVGFGGAAAMVHPSTGYHLCRMMAAAVPLAQSLATELADQDFHPDKAATKAYHTIWSPENIRQRNFAVFGGEFLMKQNVVGLRGFFDGFFRLPQPLWAGFLAGWPTLPDNDQHESWYKRIWYGLNFFVQIPWQVAAAMTVDIVGYSLSDGGWRLVQSVTPLLGEPGSYEGFYQEGEVGEDGTEIVGDVAAKAEARAMIMESKVTDELPIQLTK